MFWAVLGIILTIIAVRMVVSRIGDQFADIQERLDALEKDARKD